MSKIDTRNYPNIQTNWGNELCDSVMKEDNEFFSRMYRSHFNLYFLVYLRQLNTQHCKETKQSEVAKDFYDFFKTAEITHGYQAVYDLFETYDQLELFHVSSLAIDSKQPDEIQWTVNADKKRIVQTARAIVADLKRVTSTQSPYERKG